MKEFESIVQPVAYQFGNHSVKNRIITVYDLDTSSYLRIKVEDLNWSEVACMNNGQEGVCQLGVVFYIMDNLIHEKYFKCFFPYTIQVLPPDLRIPVIKEL